MKSEIPWTFEQALQILADNKAEVKYSDTFVSSRGTVTRRPELGAYSLIWEQGVIESAFMEYADAVKQAAIFITLWKSGINASDANKLSHATVGYWVVTREENVLCFDRRQ